MKPKWSSARVAASEIIVKASGSTGEGLEISLTLRSVWVLLI
jgi:hypothetical protein